MENKRQILENTIRDYGSVAVAFSGGVDSTFLLKVCHEVLAEKAVAITARAVAFSEDEMAEAEAFCMNHGIRHLKVDLAWADIRVFEDNPTDRCYICKKAIFGKLIEIASANGLNTVADGTNLDDVGDYRPGMKALVELGVRSPLKEAGLSKQEIRDQLKEMGMPIWDKPAYACLATRIPYGEKITPEKLKRIGDVEAELRELGFRQVRARHHGDIIRIEVPPEDRAKFFDLALMDLVNDLVKKHGYTFGALDLGGYKTGNMNQGLGGK